MIELLNKPWSYTLYDANEALLLSVLCGGAAMFEVNIYLDSIETDQYIKAGNGFIEELVKNIQSEPTKYKDRNVYIKG